MIKYFVGVDVADSGDKGLVKQKGFKHPVATVQLAGQSMVEIDQLGVAKSRPPTAGRLPAGIAMVSFVFDNIDNIGIKPVSPPQRLEGKLYGGQRVAVCRGAGGELIELIEAAV